MIVEIKEKIGNEKTSSKIDALKKGMTPLEIRKMSKRSGVSHPKLEVFDI